MASTKLLTVYFAGGVITLVAWVLNVSQLYWMAAVLLLLPQASRLFTLLEQRGIKVERQLPLAAHQGETVVVRFSARNLLPIPKLHLSLRDELPAGLTPIDPEPVPVHLPPQGSDYGEYVLQLRRRGVHALSHVRLSSTDLLGLTRCDSRLPVASQILVYPRVLPLPPSMLPPEMGGGQAPLDVSSRQGEGSSFFGIREYRPGDPLRHVHWRTAARIGRLAVVEWEAEESRDALLAVETLKGSDRDLEQGTTLDLAAGLAASLAAMILGGGDSLRVMAPGVTGWQASPDRGIEALPALLETLARMTADADIALAAQLRLVAPQLAPRTLVCWFTAVAGEEVAATARYLRAANLRPVVYALVDAPRGRPGPWDAVAAELEAVQVPVIRVDADDELAVRLLS